MPLDVTQFREQIVRPTLQKMQLWSESAEDLLVGTALFESNLEFVMQKPSGPALGVYQMEPFTYNDLRTRILSSYSKIADRALAVLCMDILPTDASYLMGNMVAATIFARFKYFFDKEPIPDSSDVAALSAYYKRIYNTPQGAADINNVIKVFRSVVGGYVHHA